jgi:RNA polymerase sigma-70 factor (ECF subfamily)
VQGVIPARGGHREDGGKESHMAGPRQDPDAEVDSDELVRRVLAGDTASFAQLVRRHQVDVWKVAAAMLTDRVATENLVQQTFVNAYERLDQYQPGRDLVRWLKGIARNLVRQELRKRTRETEHMTHYRDYLGALYSEDDRSDQRTRELEAALRACREQLSPAAARALDLQYEQGLSVEEVATALDRTLAATRQLLFRTRLALRECVERRLLAT